MVVKRKDKRNGCMVENVGIAAGEEFGDVVGTSVSHMRISKVSVWARHDGVRDSGRSSRRDRDIGDHRVQAPTPRAMECDSRGDKQPLRQRGNDRGQSTVEFAVVTAGFLAATIALSAVWHAFGDGLLVEHALAVASHHVQAVAPATIVDVFLY